MGDSILSGLLSGVGSSLLGGIMGKDRQDSTFKQQLGLMAQQNAYNVAASAKAFKREVRQATTEWKRNLYATEQAYLRERNAYRNRYQWTMADMRDAGLNPILAASGGFNVGSQVDTPPARAIAASAQALGTGLASAPMHPVNLPNLSSSARDLASAFQSEKEVEKKDAEIAKLIQDTKTSGSQMKKNLQDISESRSRQGKLRAEERKIVQEMFNLENTFTKISEETNRIIQETRNLELTEMEKRKNLRILRQKQDVLTQTVRSMRMYNTQLEKVTEVYKGKAGPFIGHMKAVTQAIGLNVKDLATTAAIIAK